MKYALVILLCSVFVSCKSYSTVIIDKQGHYVLCDTHKRIPQPAYELFHGMWIVRYKTNKLDAMALVTDTAGVLEYLKKR